MRLLQRISQQRVFLPDYRQIHIGVGGGLPRFQRQLQLYLFTEHIL